MAAHSLEEEEKRFQQEVAEVKAWWQDSRWRFTKRPFTAEQIVSKRGTITPSYANNEMSKKLWNTVEQRFAVSGAPRRSMQGDTLTHTSAEQGCQLHLRLP